MSSKFKNNLSDLSAIGTEFEITDYDNQKAIRKITNLNEKFHDHNNEIINQISLFISNLELAGIELPRIYDVQKESASIIFICEYSGDTVVENFQAHSLEDFITNTTYFDQMLEIIKKVQSADLHLDPHPKNFVLASEKITYVDFTPPYGDKYFNLRLSLANDNEDQILNDFFNTLNKESLGYHLAGDIMKIDTENYHHLPMLYKKMSELNIIQPNYEYFIKRLNEIINIEKGRELGNIFLI
tara:strand:- start:3651 stop:4376 length:726 start_codon:yes stop_codon:yes gene_type:complete